MGKSIYFRGMEGEESIWGCFRVGNESPGMWDPLILCPHVILQYPRGTGTPQIPKNEKAQFEITPNIGMKIFIVPYRNQIIGTEIHKKLTSATVSLCIFEISAHGGKYVINKRCVILYRLIEKLSKNGT